MKGVISSPTFLLGTAFTLLIFMVAVMMLTVNAAKSTVDIELVEVTRMYGNTIADFLINSPNWYSIDRLRMEMGDKNTYGLGLDCQYYQGGSQYSDSFEETGEYAVGCGSNPGGVMYGDGSMLKTGDAGCKALTIGGDKVKCKNTIPFSTKYYLHSDCGCLALEETIGGETVVHPGVIDWAKVAKNSANCDSHPVPFCIDAGGYYWRATVTKISETGETVADFGWPAKYVGDGDTTIKKVVGVYDSTTKRILPGKLVLQVSADVNRKRISIPG